MSSTTRTKRATLDDLMRFDGKAELIGGRIVPLMASGHRPSLIAGEILVRLQDHARAIGRGVAFMGKMSFTVAELSSGRESFSPDVSYYDGPPPSDEMDFVPGAPTFAVEVRSKEDYGASAEAEMAAKRADYFEAGTLVVWDVDPRPGCVRAYRADEPNRPVVFEEGWQADAEPAVPGWRMAVSEIFG